MPLHRFPLNPLNKEEPTRKAEGPLFSSEAARERGNLGEPNICLQTFSNSSDRPNALYSSGELIYSRCSKLVPWVSVPQVLSNP